MERDPDRVSLEGIDPETALKALLKVDPEPVEQDEPAERRDEQDEGRKA